MAPTTKRIAKWFDISSEQALAIRNLIKVAETGTNKDVDAALDGADKIIGGFGTEAVTGDWWSHYWQNITALYINTGDTYNPTIVYNPKTDKFKLTTLGDFV